MRLSSRGMELQIHNLTGRSHRRGAQFSLTRRGRPICRGGSGSGINQSLPHQKGASNSSVVWIVLGSLADPKGTCARMIKHETFPKWRADACSQNQNKTDTAQEAECSLMRRTGRGGRGAPRPVSLRPSGEDSPVPALPSFLTSPQSQGAPAGIPTGPDETCPGAVEAPGGPVRQSSTSPGDVFVTPERSVVSARRMASTPAGRPTQDTPSDSDRFEPSQHPAGALTAYKSPAVVTSSPTSPTTQTMAADARQGESVQRSLVVRNTARSAVGLISRFACVHRGRCVRCYDERGCDGTGGGDCGRRSDCERDAR